MARGGSRAGAGRRQGSGKFGEPTKAIRVPASQVDIIYRLVQNNFNRLPFYSSTVQAGFPSIADDESEEALDLNDLLIKNPPATFLLKVSGSSMIKAGIHDGDILVVDRSLQPAHGKIVIAAVNGELTVKRLSCQAKNKVQLVAENDRYPPIDITEGIDLHIWGVVTNVIHKL